MPFNISGYTVPSNGAPAPYFVINRISLEPINSILCVNVNGYTSQADYAANLQPVTSQNFTINDAAYVAFLASVTGADIPAGTTQGALLTELIGALQTNMLTLPFFTAATIVS